MEILHGRREGQQRSVPQQQHVDFQRIRQFGMNMKDVAVFQPQDWHRIQNSLNKYNAEAEECRKRQEERKQLQKSSKELVKNWGNTIDGQRLKKLQARKLREKNDEIEKEKIDIEEAKLQAKQRKEAIEKARTLQYYQTDRVKKFHGALLLTEVLKERDAQVGMKQLRTQWEEKRDRELLVMQNKQMEEKILQDHEKAMERIRKKRELARFQIAQIEDNLKANQQERDEELEEGRQVKQEVESYQAAKKDIHEQRRQDKIKLREIYKQEIQSREILNSLKEEQEKLEDEQIDRFVTAKRAMAKMRKEKEEEIFESLQNHAEKMRSKLHAQMQQKVDDEDSRILKAVTEQEKKRLDEEKEKTTKRDKAQKAMYQHRATVMKRAKEREIEERKKNKLMLEQNMKDDEMFLKKQRQLDLQKRNTAKQLQRIHREQITKNKELDEHNVEIELELDRENERLLQQEEEEFQRYAKEVIEAAEKRGRNKYPLVKAAAEGPGGGRGPKFEGKAGIRPSYIVADATGVQLPHHRKDEETNHRNYGHVGRSGKRLGFTW